MKPQIKIIPLLITLGISALIGYAFFAANSGEEGCTLMFVLAGITSFIMLGSGFGVKYAERGSSNVNVLGCVFFILHMIVNLIFTFAPFRFAPYIIISGILCLLYIGIAYALANALN